jgi:hypothetical protein
LHDGNVPQVFETAARAALEYKPKKKTTGCAIL